MLKILKRFQNPEASSYVFQSVEKLAVEDKKPNEESPEEAASVSADEADETESEENGIVVHPEASPAEKELGFAKIQAEAILKDAREEAEAYKEQARKEFETELSALRKTAREDGYSQGYAEGMASAMAEGKLQREEMAKEQVKAVEKFLEGAARERDQLLDDSREELKDLAIAIAEKVIRVSLKNSSDILLRMVDAATDTHKRCEWAHIYVADCDVQGKAYTAPELTAALGHLSNRIRVIPMADDESGTCIVELPDVILDASVSTQLGAIREILDSTGLDRE